MGWFVADDGEGPPMLEHNGVLSTYYADAVKLPDRSYGVVLLSNSFHATGSHLAVKEAVVGSLVGDSPAGGPPPAPAVGVGLAVLTIATISLGALGYARAPRWAARRTGWPGWRSALRMPVLVAPAALVVALPRMTAAFADRFFGHRLLFLSMPHVMAWPMAAGLVGVAVGIARSAHLVRAGGGSPPPRVQ